MAEQEHVKQLNAKRGQAKAACTRAKSFIESVDLNNVSRLELKHRRMKLEECWEKFNATQEEIEILQDQEQFFIEHEKERVEFEQQYFYVANSFDEAVAEAAPPITSAGTPHVDDTNMSAPHMQVRLPIIDLPKFTGAYDEWFPFFDTFNLLIHSDPRLRNIQKFQYLKSALHDDAAELIKSLEISDINYIEAWNMLKARYDSKRIVVQKHVKAMLDVPVLNKETYAGLRQLIDAIQKHLRALKALGRPTESWDDVIICILLDKLDHATRKAWEVSIPGSDMPTLKQVLDFLSQRCQALESLSKETRDTHTVNKFTRNKGSLSHAAVDGKAVCPLCKDSHYIYQCNSFRNLSAEERIKRVSSLKLCFNCLRTTAHRANTCESGCCKKCGKRHSTLLHKIETTSGENLVAHEDDETVTQPKQTQTATVVRQALIATKSDSLLSTAVVSIRDQHGRLHHCRTFLDSGSQSNFITENLITKLGLSTQSINMPVLGFHQGHTRIRRQAEVEIQSRINHYKTRLDCLIIDRITSNLPLVSFDRAAITIPSNIKLADPDFHVSAEIDLLIGVDEFWKLLCVGQIRTSNSQPLFQKTHLGWIIAGDFHIPISTTQKKVCNLALTKNVDSLLTRFWELDQVCAKHNMSPDESHCDEHYMRTFQRNQDGRFVVTLPIKNGLLEQLGESRNTAVRRFHALERRLSKEPQLKMEYSNFMYEYEQLGHMRVVDERNRETRPHFYLPHHAVLKETSLTTKLRVVFDASCKTHTGISLNDILMVGPTLQQDIFAILVRFRAHYYVLSADIAKMYRQVLIHPSQTPLQRIVWCKSPEEELKDYELLTVTYGTASAAFLVTKTLQQLAISQGQNYAIGSAMILRDFYVDDLLTGSNSLQEALTIRDEVIRILSSAGFELRKWLSNQPELLQNLPIKSGEHSVLKLGKAEFTSTLGIKWNASQDIFQYDTTSIQNVGERITKRSILSTIAKVFDPLGLLGPVMLSAKIIMQRLWVLKVHWDETLPMEIHTAWKRLESEWSELSNISIPRKIICDNNPRGHQLHGFSDASQDGYGACIYVRSTNEEGNHYVRLLCAKSRVSPLKNISLPRLELCGALLLAELMSVVVRALPFHCNQIYFWTDSTIVLNWIHSPSRRWVTFVANRVGIIQELSGAAKWQHVNGKENPADLISRGVTPAALRHSQLWWHGPLWLKADSSSWPKQTMIASYQDLPEQRPVNVLSMTISSEPFYSRFSSFKKLVNVIAYCRRFTHNARQCGSQHLRGPLTPQELNDSTNSLVRLVQQEQFSSEIDLLRNGKDLPRSSKLLALNPFLSEEIIRVGGRLRNSELPFHCKHPAVLPAKHHVTQLIIEEYHKRQLHAGAQGTLAAIREYYWPLAARSTVRKIIRSCIRCFKASPKSSQQIMGDLPAQRIRPARPFSIVGVDYCGPFYVREGARKNTKRIKSYAVIFVCMVTKAVHIELVLDMTTEAYLAALKRFMARRGRPFEIHSDNGSTFVGADNELKELHDMFNKEDRYNKIISTLGAERISWRFIPPRAPHFGGIWEAAVKATKHHLTRIAGEASLNYVQLYTLLTQIEAVLNSRPLIPLSTDPNDFSFISPAHFLIGATIMSYPEPDLTDTRQNLLSKWQHVEQLKQHFWHRWVKEYLHLCQQRTRWKESRGPQLTVGTLVVIHDDNAPPMHWVMGRIEAIHPGEDGVVRAATVKTSKGVFKRPATKLHVLPVDNY